MRKLWVLFMSLFMIFLLYGCAMEDMNPSEPDMYTNLTYSFDTMTFTETFEFDILYKTGNPLDDYLILCNNYGIDLDASSLSAYEVLFDKLISLSDSSLVNLGEIFTYSSVQLQTILSGYSVQLSLNDVVIFNEVKSTLSIIKESEETYYVMSKIDYVEQRLVTSLTEENIDNLNLLQEYFLVIYPNNETIIFHEMTLDAVISMYENKAGEIPELVREKLMNAYDLVTLLVTS